MNWEEKVKKERQQLIKKIYKLDEFLKGPIDSTISDYQIRLLTIQLHTMRAYADILTARLEEM